MHALPCTQTKKSKRCWSRNRNGFRPKYVTCNLGLRTIYKVPKPVKAESCRQEGEELMNAKTTLPVMQEKKHVLCKDCKHHMTYVPGHVLEVSICKTQPVVRLDPVEGHLYTFVLCKERNANMDCPFFEQKRKPWWKFW